MKIDINKKYRTKAGANVVIHALNGPIEGRPVVYSREGTSGHWHFDSCAEDGRDLDAMPQYDLVEIREPREWELVVASSENRTYKTGTIDEKATADLQAGDRRVPHGPWEIVRVREIID